MRAPAREHSKPDDVSDVSGACNYTAEKEGLSFTGVIGKHK